MPYRNIFLCARQDRQPRRGRTIEHFLTNAILLFPFPIANLLIYHVGYGNAAGFLVNRGIPIDPSTASTSDSGSGTFTSRAFDPITGRYTEDTGPALADMTDEEKEREAERLFVLFERLNRTGVVTAENPIAKAMREGYGRVEEVEDNEDDD